jgi:hypothetical protein
MPTNPPARFRALLCAAVSAFWLSTAAAVAQQSMPTDVRIDLAIAGLERAIVGDDAPGILAQIDTLRRLAPALIVGDLLYYEARALASLDRVQDAEAVLQRFLRDPGRASPRYNDALQLMLELEPRVAAAAAAAAAERAAEAERARAQAAADAQRAREAAAAEAEAAARRSEAAEWAEMNSITLNAAQRAHILWVLRSRYLKDSARVMIYEDALNASRDAMPDTLNDVVMWMGNNIARYKRDEGIPGRTNALTRATVDRLLAEPFVPLRRSYETTPTYSQLRRFGDWVSHSAFIRGAGRCIMEVEATEWSGIAPYAAPVLMIYAYEQDARGRIIAELPATITRYFEPKTVSQMTLNIDGRYIAYGLDKTVEVDRYASNRSDLTFVRFLLGAQGPITVRGNVRGGGGQGSVTFSSRGLRDAFAYLIQDCRRRDLSTYLERLR